VQSAVKPNQVERAKAAIIDTIQRAADPRYARDAVLNLPIIPEPERRFVQAMTGGVPGDVITELPPDFLSYIKDAQLKKERMQASGDLDLSVAPLAQWLARKGSGQLSMYGYGRDIQNSLGEIGLWKDKKGDVLIKDRWKVDNSSMSGPKGSESELTKKRMYSDLGEGGPIASWLFNKAREAGTYRPFDYEIRIPAAEWESIEAKDRGVPSFDHTPGGRARDFLYDVLSYMVAPDVSNNPFEGSVSPSSKAIPYKFINPVPSPLAP